MRTLGDLSREYDSDNGVSKWEYENTICIFGFMECPDCKTIDGFKHWHSCERAPLRQSRTVVSQHGRIAHRRWCEIEAAKSNSLIVKSHTMDDGRVACRLERL